MKSRSKDRKQMKPRRSRVRRRGKLRTVTEQPLVRPSGSAIFSEQAWNEVGRRLKLSGRELQIVRGMFNDKIELAIASDLGISHHTVHTHIERLYDKLAVTNRGQLFIQIMMEFVTMTASPKSAMSSVRAGGSRSHSGSLLEPSPRKRCVGISTRESGGANGSVISRPQMQLDKYGSKLKVSTD